MPSSYAVRQLGRDATDETIVLKQTVVYADTEAEARAQGASMLGLPQSAIQVDEIEATPSDAVLNAVQEDAIATASVPDYMRNASDERR